MTLPQGSASVADDAEVLLARRGGLGHLRLNRPAKINALTAGMVTTIADALSRWAGDPGVSAILIDGAGERGLCAGGDIAAVYDGIRGAGPHPEAFWRAEYRMNLQIAEYPKPVIALMDGLVLGGGIGIAGHAAVRVVTETAQCAMPETAIGLSPDVGGLYLLSRAPGELGTYAALGGARLGAADAMDAGLADAFVPRAALPVLVGRLAQLPAGTDAHDAARGVIHDATPDGAGDDVGDGARGRVRSAPCESVFAAVRAAVDAVAREYRVTPPAGRWRTDRAWIDACYRGDDAGAILAALRGCADPAAAPAADHLAAMSPTAVAMTLRALRAAASMTLREVLAQDLQLSMAFTRHPDLAEGIRARVIDKDRRPRWQPATLDDVSAADVDAFFSR